MMEKFPETEKMLRDIGKEHVQDRDEILAGDYDVELEMLKSTRDNFLTWKDYDY